MVYEARQSTRLNYALAGACLLLSILGFAAAGVIPTQSGSYPLVGWTIVAACSAAAWAAGNLPKKSSVAASCPRPATTANCACSPA